MLAFVGRQNLYQLRGEVVVVVQCPRSLRAWHNHIASTIFRLAGRNLL